MTDRTLQALEAARRIMRGEDVDDFLRVDLAHALVELAGGRPNAVDRQRIEEGDWERAAGDTMCFCSHGAERVCHRPYYDHPVVPGYEWLRRLCNGGLVKL